MNLHLWTSAITSTRLARMHISVNPLSNGTKLFLGVPRLLMAALGKSSSHILCLKDQALNEFFIIDTGSVYSIVKSNSFEIANYSSEQFLIAANASKISTHVERTMNLLSLLKIAQSSGHFYLLRSVLTELVLIFRNKIILWSICTTTFW